MNIVWEDIFKYENGCLYWKIKPTKSRVPIGALTGRSDIFGYVKVGYKRKTYYAHRIIWEMHFGPLKKDLVIDHIDGIKNNNKIENLRLVSHSQNARNRKSHRNGKIHGVFKTKNGYRSIINVGSFTNKKEAEDMIIKVQKLLKENKCGQF